MTWRRSDAHWRTCRRRVEEIPRHTPWRDAATFSRRRLVPAALMCSLLVNGFLVAERVAGKGEEATQVAIRMVTLTQSSSSVSAPTVPPTSSTSNASADRPTLTREKAAAKVSAATAVQSNAESFR